MKKFEDFDVEDLLNLRSQIVLNSMFTADFNNDMGITAKSVSEFMDGYYDYLWELALENNSNATHEDVMELDTAENLYSWYMCYDDFSWVEYEDEEDED